MEFYENQYFHIFNQGNNKQPIFFIEDNYYYFLRKVKKHLLSNVDVLSYCLMPNHFHFLVQCKSAACEKSKILKPWSEEGGHYQQNLSHGIAVLLRSYTRAINIQEGRTGSLFRKKTKFKDRITDLFEKDVNYQLNDDYLKECSEYIHNNPVKAGLVGSKEEWLFSSYSELIGKSKLNICNKGLVKKLNLI